MDTSASMMVIRFTALGTDEGRKPLSWEKKMDPNQTFYELLLALQENSPFMAQDAALDLIAWIENGGFKPKALEAALDAARKEL